MLVLLGAVPLIVLGAWSIRRARQELSVGTRLSAGTVVVVWVLYTVHAALSGLAAWKSLLLLPIDAVIASTLGAVLALVGTVLYVGGVLSFRSFKRMSGMDSTQLISTGMYRWSRNPQNIGWGVFLVGIALWGRSGLALLLAAAFWIIFRIYLPMEEGFLEEVFGHEYRSYRATTPRYLGWPRGHRRRG